MILWATCVAFFMAILNAQGATPDLLAAVRTTTVVVLGWGFACCRYGFRTWSELSLPVRCMLISSALAVILAWLLNFQARGKRSAAQVAVMDRLNIGFAVLFTSLLLWQRASIPSVIIGLCIVCGSFFLAFVK